MILLLLKMGRWRRAELELWLIMVLRAASDYTGRRVFNVINFAIKGNTTQVTTLNLDCN